MRPAEVKILAKLALLKAAALNAVTCDGQVAINLRLAITADLPDRKNGFGLDRRPSGHNSSASGRKLAICCSC